MAFRSAKIGASHNMESIFERVANLPELATTFEDDAHGMLTMGGIDDMSYMSMGSSNAMHRRFSHVPHSKLTDVHCVFRVPSAGSSGRPVDPKGCTHREGRQLFWRWLLQTAKPQGSSGAYTCPLKDCNTTASDKLQLLLHTIDCPRLEKGKYECQTCGRDERFPRSSGRAKDAWCFVRQSLRHLCRIGVSPPTIDKVLHNIDPEAKGLNKENTNNSDNGFQELDSSETKELPFNIRCENTLLPTQFGKGKSTAVSYDSNGYSSGSPAWKNQCVESAVEVTGDYDNSFTELMGDYNILLDTAPSELHTDYHGAELDTLDSLPMRLKRDRIITNGAYLPQTHGQLPLSIQSTDIQNLSTSLAARETSPSDILTMALNRGYAYPSPVGSPYYAHDGELGGLSTQIRPERVGDNPEWQSVPFGDPVDQNTLLFNSQPRDKAHRNNVPIAQLGGFREDVFPATPTSTIFESDGPDEMDSDDRPTLLSNLRNTSAMLYGPFLESGEQLLAIQPQTIDQMNTCMPNHEAMLRTGFKVLRATLHGQSPVSAINMWCMFHLAFAAGVVVEQSHGFATADILMHDVPRWAAKLEDIHEQQLFTELANFALYRCALRPSVNHDFGAALSSLEPQPALLGMPLYGGILNVCTPFFRAFAELNDPFVLQLHGSHEQEASNLADYGNQTMNEEEHTRGLEPWLSTSNLQGPRDDQGTYELIQLIDHVYNCLDFELDHGPDYSHMQFRGISALDQGYVGHDSYLQGTFISDSIHHGAIESTPCHSRNTSQFSTQSMPAYQMQQGSATASTLTSPQNNPRLASSGTGEVFFCQSCGMIFKGEKKKNNRANLKRHVKEIHGDRSSWQCNLCPTGKKFTRKDNLNAHRFKRHGLEPSGRRRERRSRMRRNTNPT